MSFARLYNATNLHTAIIWSNGFKSQLAHLAALGALEVNGKIQVAQEQAIKEPRLWLFGYGD